MKELEKTKRISIASVLFILLIIIALLAYKKPKFNYTMNSQMMLENVIKGDYFVSLEDLKPEFVLVDVRSAYDFNKGHLENAINMYSPEILSENNIAILDKSMEENKTVVMYGSNPDEVLVPYMVLYQLGYSNLKIATISNTYANNKLITKNTPVEVSNGDISAFIAESIKKAESKPKPQPVKTVKKIVPVLKKKKMPVEGGC